MCLPIPAYDPIAFPAELPFPGSPSSLADGTSAEEAMMKTVHRLKAKNYGFSRQIFERRIQVRNPGQGFATCRGGRLAGMGGEDDKESGFVSNTGFTSFGLLRLSIPCDKYRKQRSKCRLGGDVFVGLALHPENSMPLALLVSEEAE
jgi:hypothetical protein